MNLAVGNVVQPLLLPDLVFIIGETLTCAVIKKARDVNMAVEVYFNVRGESLALISSVYRASSF